MTIYLNGIGIGLVILGVVLLMLRRYPRPDHDLRDAAVGDGSIDHNAKATYIADWRKAEANNTLLARIAASLVAMGFALQIAAAF